MTGKSLILLTESRRLVKAGSSEERYSAPETPMMNRPGTPDTALKPYRSFAPCGNKGGTTGLPSRPFYWGRDFCFSEVFFNEYMSELSQPRSGLSISTPAFSVLKINWR